MRESRRCAKVVESAGTEVFLGICAIGRPLVFPARSGDDNRAERNTTAITAANEKAVELEDFIGVVRSMGGGKNFVIIYTEISVQPRSWKGVRLSFVRRLKSSMMRAIPAGFRRQAHLYSPPKYGSDFCK